MLVTIFITLVANNCCIKMHTKILFAVFLFSLGVVHSRRPPPPPPNAPRPPPPRPRPPPPPPGVRPPPGAYRSPAWAPPPKPFRPPPGPVYPFPRGWYPPAHPPTTAPTWSSFTTQPPCLLERLCGTDGNSYPSLCAMPKGVGVACNRYCPCQVPTTTTTTTKPPPTCQDKCSLNPAPVCGTNGKTYKNWCFLDCAYAVQECSGPCPCSKPTPPPLYVPTYNICQCPPYGPQVCGTNGQTYANDCSRNCENVPKACNGACPCQQQVEVEQENKPKAVAVTQAPWIKCQDCYLYPGDTVCGNDGISYFNACAAKCHDTEIKCYSDCPC